MNNQIESSQSIYLEEQTYSQEKKLAQLFSQRSYNFMDENQLLFKNFEGFPEWKDLLQLYSELVTAHSSYKQINNGKWRPWDANEINLLNIVCQLYCSGRCLNPLMMNSNDWDQISQIMFNRHWKLCRSKWLDGRAISVIERPWKREEDEMLSFLFEQNHNVNKVNKWKEISIELSRACKTPYVRMGKQCRERWMNQLNPGVEKGPWYQEDELILLQNIQKYGKKWSLISRSCYGLQRTENSLKNRYHTILKRESSKLINYRKDNIKHISEQEIVQKIINKFNPFQKVKRILYQVNQFYSDDCDIFHLAVIKKNKIQVIQI